jgi:putative two-component system response regulator
VFILSRQLDLPAEECELLQQACPMHDLGKIAVPDEILMKKRRLTKADREAIELHAVEGEKILSGHNSELLKTAATIARSHHENWDGSGYPDGLAGEDIPMCARIVAVCHVFDALTSDRPYRKAWKVNKAVTFILEQSGYKFDPRIVAAFEQVIDQVVMCWQAEHTAASNNHSIN